MEKRTPSQLWEAFWPRLLVALIIAVSLAGIADHDLWTPDEPREAAISLSMSQSGDFLIPELAGKPFVEKPPLFYIIASFFLRVFGQLIGNTAALRLVSACFGLLTLLFTYLLGKIYFDRQKALIAAGILATTFGFVHVTHWLLVDNALMFFITASVWALAKAYPDLPGSRDSRLFYLPLAGMLAAFAFLAKGMIGPLIIFIAWLGIFIPWVKYGGVGQPCPTEPNGLPAVLRPAMQAGGTGCPALPRLKFPFFKFDACLGYHALALIAFGLICAIWIIAFSLQGGPELFREWWWTNHFGRFTGAAQDLGHISPWYYYFYVLPIYLLPWIIPFAAAIVFFLKKAWRGEAMAKGCLLFIFWSLGTFLLLSLSATKRDIYLSALLPAGALLCLYGPEKARGLARVTGPSFQRFLMIAAGCYAVLLMIACPIIDRYKSYGPAFRSMADAIRAHPELKIAGWNFDETTTAGFYYYCGFVFPSIADQKVLDDILQGRNIRFNGALFLKKNAGQNYLPARENQVIFETRMGKRRLLQLLAAPDYKHRQ